MYKPINGFTKQSILDVIAARPFEERSVYASGGCAYIAPDGNRCAVGLFLPDKYEDSVGSSVLGVRALLDKFEYLKQKMPLPTDALAALQLTHDSTSKQGNAKQRMLDWVKANVED